MSEVGRLRSDLPEESVLTVLASPFRFHIFFETFYTCCLSNQYFFELLPVVLPDVSVIMDEVSSQSFPTTTADFEAATL